MVFAPAATTETPANDFPPGSMPALPRHTRAGAILTALKRRASLCMRRDTTQSEKARRLQTAAFAPGGCASGNGQLVGRSGRWRPEQKMARSEYIPAIPIPNLVQFLPTFAISTGRKPRLDRQATPFRRSAQTSDPCGQRQCCRSSDRNGADGLPDADFVDQAVAQPTSRRMKPRA